VSGLCVAIGGGLKDSRWEGFKPIVFLRSPLIGVFLSLLFPWPDFFNLYNDALFFFVGIGMERCIVELYKLMRRKKPGKFDFGEWQ
jgi:hypothetical protein